MDLLCLAIQNLKNLHCKYEVTFNWLVWPNKRRVCFPLRKQWKSMMSVWWYCTMNQISSLIQEVDYQMFLMLLIHHTKHTPYFLHYLQIESSNAANSMFTSQCFNADISGSFILWGQRSLTLVACPWDHLLLLRLVFLFHNSCSADDDLSLWALTEIQTLPLILLISFVVLW